MRQSDDITLTIQEVRRVAARTAARYGATFDVRLLSLIDECIAHVINEGGSIDSRGDPDPPIPCCSRGGQIETSLLTGQKNLHFASDAKNSAGSGASDTGAQTT